jgi:hypothetical protein
MLPHALPRIEVIELMRQLRRAQLA